MPEPMAFTKRNIEALPPSASGTRTYYEDTRIPGLRLAVTDRGVKSWVVQRRIDGQVKRITLGRYPDLTPENARKHTEQTVGKIADGRDPQTEKREARSNRLTLQEAFDEFLRRRPLKTSTSSGYQQIIKAAFADWLSRPLTKITSDMIAERHAKLSITSGGPYADSAMRTLRSIWNFAAAGYEDRNGVSLLGVNPVIRLSKTKAWHRTKRRETFIREHELPAWFAAVQELRSEPWGTSAQTVGDYLALLILTGLRRREASGLRWDQVDLKAKTLKILDTKNHDDHTLPLSDFLHELLSARKEQAQSSPFVFASSDSDIPLNDPRIQANKVIKASGVEFTLHDLRRTFCTIAESLDLSHYALKRLLNHRMSGDITAGYIGKNVERLREPMQRITSFVLSAAEIRPAAQVISIDTVRTPAKR